MQINHIPKLLLHLGTSILWPSWCKANMDILLVQTRKQILSLLKPAKKDTN